MSALDIAANRPELEPLKVPAVLHDTASGPMWMQIVAFLWFISTFAVFPGDGLLLYPISGVFLLSLYFGRDRVLPILFRCWWMFLIPLLALLSFTWSAYPSSTIRLSLFYILTSLSIVVIAAYLDEKQILRAFFFCAISGTALAITELGAITSTGVSEYLGQKNYYAMKMMIGMIAGFAVAMNKKENPIIRVLGMMLIPIDLFLVLAASSATSMVMSFVAIFALICAQLFWVSARGVRGMRTLIAGFFVFLCAAAALVAIGAVNNSIIADGLAALGKDSTFTGRTALWEQAERTSAENPVLGVGVGAFWQYDVGAAQTLAINDDRDPGTVLGFHNAYWEARVHLGWVGFLCLVGVITTVLWISLKSFISEGTFERACFFVAALVMFSMSFTESFLFGALQASVYIFYLAGATAIAASYRRRPIMVTLTPVPASAS